MSLEQLLGQNGVMPSRRDLPADMPEEAVRAHKAVMTPSRLELVRFLLRREDTTIREMTNGTNLGRDTIHAVLRDLEDLGYLTVSAPRGQRQGVRVTYQFNRVDFLGDLDAFFALFKVD